MYQDFESESYRGQGSEICKRTEQLNFFFTNNAEDGEKIANLLGENRKFEKKNILSRIICSLATGLLSIICLRQWSVYIQLYPSVG